MGFTEEKKEEDFFFFYSSIDILKNGLSSELQTFTPKYMKFLIFIDIEAGS